MVCVVTSILQDSFFVSHSFYSFLPLHLHCKSAFKNLLLELGYDVTWDSCPGLHDNVFWNDSLKKAADFLPIEKLEYAPDSPMNRKLRVMNETTT